VTSATARAKISRSRRDTRAGSWSGFAELAADLVNLKVDVIVAASTPAAIAARQATTTIPIVGVAMGDPVSDGLVASLALPGANVTGNTFLGPELVGKRLALLKEAIPSLLRVAGLWHPAAYGERTMQGFLQEANITAEALRLELLLVQARGPDDFETAFSEMGKARAEALFVFPSPMLFGEHARIVNGAAKSQLPGMYQTREFVDAGGLMSYGANLPDLIRRCATYVDRIVKGARPSNLPVEQPTKFEFLINLRTAKTLGLTIPPTLLASADEVIE
jgi:ABC-type uncharacterized transport system substrate-binding protein